MNNALSSLNKEQTTTINSNLENKNKTDSPETKQGGRTSNRDTLADGGKRKWAGTN